MSTESERQWAARKVRLLDFKRAVYPHYQQAAHLDLLDATLTEASLHAETNGAQGSGFVMVSMPPRSGKTLTSSRLFPAWHLGRNPDHRIILASYGATLAKRNSRAARNIVHSPAFRALFPGVTLAPDSRAAEAWNLADALGGMDAVGVGGGVTGKGGNLIIVDDPIKNRAQAESINRREAVWDWFTDDLYTRREPGAALVLVMTRWHTDDLLGRLLKREPAKWRVLRLPALAEPGDPLGRAEGDPLWPERFPLDALRDIERTQGAYAWAGLYQQRPIPAEGGIFKRADFGLLHAHAPELVQVVRYWDLAMSARTSADYSVGVKLGVGVDGSLYVLHVARRQVDWGGLVGWLAEIILQDGAGVAQGIEQKAYMSRAVADLNTDPRLRGFRVLGYPVDRDKMTRALPFAAKCGAGVVRVLDRGWTPAYLEELCSFPGGAHDDQVDASSGALAMLADASGEIDGGLSYADSPFQPLGGGY